jgi:hypothetical protein
MKMRRSQGVNVEEIWNTFKKESIWDRRL